MKWSANPCQKYKTVINGNYLFLKYFKTTKAKADDAERSEEGQSSSFDFQTRKGFLQTSVVEDTR